MSHSLFLRATDLAFAYGDRVVFDGLSFTAAAGHRIGLVGENGTGKSTLLRLLAGRELPQAGTVTGVSDIGFLDQELPYPATTVVSAVIDDALAETRAMAARLDRLAEHLAARPDDDVALVEYGHALEWAESHDLWDADRRAALVSAGLGLGAVAPDRELGTLSGGQRARLGLAALLVRRPSALLLDEPTNHLDDDAMVFLEEHLASLPGVVVQSSHDRVFLDAVCTDIVDLDPAAGGPARYGGRYSDYLLAKRAERLRWEQRFAEEQDELRRLRESVAVTARAISHDRAPRDNAKMAYDYKGGRVQRQISRRVRNAQSRLDELERTRTPKPPAPLRFAAPLTGETGEQDALTVLDVEIPGRLPRIEHLALGAGSRLLVTGGNGTGKSTLLSVLAGRLRPARGLVHRSPTVRVGMLDQDVRFPDPAMTSRQLYRSVAGDDAPALADLGLLGVRDLDRELGNLSVGQRRRLALATLIAAPPQVLLLDEPTNHISLSLTEELTEALGSAPGAVVVASHDRWLRRGWDGDRLELGRGAEVRTGSAR
ncbi:ABC-F family ATP-binding cassette domain-containing protein [Amycolatopsis marina]|uniref:ABC-F family ATP-binding cassette domain-containing protein n=1 Tax=Amycolatopsis marina TaxID=490629 RepID=UPI000B803E2A|nr:ABC-F family ATP-binding cassette domain-containing protein [Amycolatopsis marina]